MSAIPDAAARREVSLSGVGAYETELGR
jgi:hypothetical protein